MKIGVMIGRFCPLHDGHMNIIRKMMWENDKVYIIIGSANRSNFRNPIPVELRKELLEKSLCKDIKIHTLNDWSDENDTSEEWKDYLYYNIVNIIDNKNFTFYGEHNWLEKFNIPFVNTDRCEISATKVRKALVWKNYDYIKDNCPEVVYENRVELTRFIVDTLR